MGSRPVDAKASLEPMVLLSQLPLCRPNLSFRTDQDADRVLLFQDLEML